MKSVFSQSFGAAEAVAKKDINPNRRSILKGVLLVTAVSLLKPTELLALQGNALDVWRRQLCDFASAVCPGASAYISDRIWRAAAYWGSGSGDFHQSFAATYVLDLRIQPYSTVNGSRYFEFDRYPFYDSHSPCRRIKDVNEIELKRFLHHEEQKFYGGVVSPCSERRHLETQCELDDFNRTAQAYKTDPKAWEHAYVRNVTDGQKSYYAHAVKPRTSNQQQGEKQVFLSPDSV
jgi:hypothetical protein